MTDLLNTDDSTLLDRMERSPELILPEVRRVQAELHSARVLTNTLAQDSRRIAVALHNDRQVIDWQAGYIEALEAQIGDDVLAETRETYERGLTT